MNFQFYLILEMKISKFIQFSTCMCWRCCCVTLIKIIKQFWKYYEFTKSYVFFTSHYYVVRITFFFQCLSLLNAREDECLVIRVLQEGNKKNKESRGKKRSDLVCGNTPMLAYWMQIKMGKTFYKVETCSKFGSWFQSLQKIPRFYFVNK